MPQKGAKKQPHAPQPGPLSKKRKASAKMPKFYGVRAGRRPGVYKSWEDCQAQTVGFRGAQFKSWLTEEDARAFVEGRTPPSELVKERLPGYVPEWFYAVATGPKPGIYTSWEKAYNEAIAGTGNVAQKKFNTLEEAQKFIRQKATESTCTALGLHKEDDDDGYDDDEDDRVDEPAPKKAKILAQEPGVIVKDVNAGAAPTAGLKDGVLRIYTDGSALGNGSNIAKGGIGVYFGEGDSRNFSGRLFGEPQTNNRAELSAVQKALEIAHIDQDVEIFTDSQYSIDCLTTWYKKWMMNAWKTSSGGDVQNRDLIQSIRNRINDRRGRNATTIFVWVKGHAKNRDNEAADRLANDGANW